MEERARTELTHEYIKNIRIYSIILKIGGWNRFDVKDGQIVSISRFSQFCSLLAIITVSLAAYILILQTSIMNNYLILPEFITVIELVVLNNVVLLNIHIFNRHSGAKLYKEGIEIDLFLGVTQTKVMRDIVMKDMLIWSTSIASFELVIFAVLIIAFYNKLPVYIYFVGIVYFHLLFTLCYDQGVHMCLYKFLCLRVHYLNVGLVKIANLYTAYLIEQLISYPFHWKKEYDNNVDLSRKDRKYFTESLRMVDAQVRRVQHSYRFMVSSIQCIPICPRPPWTIFIGITQQTDKLNMQIQRTKLICTYIQLKPNNSDELLSLSRSILDTLAVSDYRISIYNLFYFDQRLLFSIATSVFVYITMQLQLAFPKRNSPNAEKEVNGAVDHAAAAAKDAKNTATKQAEHANHAIHPEHANHANHPEHGNHAIHSEHAKRNARDHTGGAKHGGEGGQKRGAGLERPFTNIIKEGEEFGTKMADQGVKVLTDLFGLFNV
ncbi:uncharacterized protein LOC134806747 [Cydia splendana]|uniref:uncharacterized protein LOC134806747 n=1 Tax=Cydia splendana TaxID=1100963 RepID=UPI00300CD3F2